MIRVLVVDEVRLMAHVAASVLKNEPDIEVIGCAATAEEALKLAQDCDIVLLSISLPNHTALELTSTLVKTYPKLKVIVTGVVESEEVILPFIEAGVAGYVLKDDSVDKLLDTIRAVSSGEAAISPAMAAALMARLTELAELAKSVGDEATPSLVPVPDLTPREREVLDLIALGLSNSEIAARLTLELGTVKNHVHHILEKLNVSSRADAVAYLAAVEGNLNRDTGLAT